MDSYEADEYDGVKMIFFGSRTLFWKSGCPPPHPACAWSHRKTRSLKDEGEKMIHYSTCNDESEDLQFFIRSEEIL